LPVSPFYSEAVAIIDLACWGLCFWWMHRISSRQNAVLDQLRKQAERIERVSREEHQILQEVHPKLEKIEKNIDKVAD
jgi:iron-sulfur cluster repair protein YtfE (RIC family)